MNNGFLLYFFRCCEYSIILYYIHGKCSFGVTGIKINLKLYKTNTRKRLVVLTKT